MAKEMSNKTPGKIRATPQKISSCRRSQKEARNKATGMSPVKPSVNRKPIIFRKYLNPPMK
jgi:hypothetical protein